MRPTRRKRLYLSVLPNKVASPTQMRWLQLAVEHLLATPADRALCLLWYGSRKTGSDLDLLAITADEPNQQHIQFGRIDLRSLSVGEVAELVQFFDPIVTEPLLGGIVVWGSPSLALRAAAGLRRLKPNVTVVRRLLTVSKAHCRAASFFYDRFKRTQRGGFLLPVISRLSFSLGYRAFAHHYAKGGEATLLRDLPRSRLFKQVEQALNAAKKPSALVTGADVKGMLRRTSNSIMLK